jgi:UDP-N-acetylmuramate dehydrogenase
MNLPSNLLPAYSLSQRNTLGFEVEAEFAIHITEAKQIAETLAYAKDHNMPYQVLGGGSNVVLPSALPGLTLLMDIAGIEIVSEDANGVSLKVGAGVSWHSLVIWTLEHSYPGLENLALIPGTVGAAPIQNIGAYGVEIENYINSVEAFDSQAMQWVTLDRAHCQFSYRHSLFKAHPLRYIISAVNLYLPKQWQPRISYADLQHFFAGKENGSITPLAIFEAVCEIRTQKLPDPKQIGNVGSFFQNPIVENSMLAKLKQRHPAIVAYPEDTNHSKLAAGWLIDHCGFKGLRTGNVGVHDKQALVLIHHGGGNANELLQLAERIQKTIREQFEIDLQIEPIIFNT